MVAPAGQVAYRLGLPASMQIHPIFYVLILKPYNKAAELCFQPPPAPIEVDAYQEFKAARILYHRY